MDKFTDLVRDVRDVKYPEIVQKHEEVVTAHSEVIEHSKTISESLSSVTSKEKNIINLEESSRLSVEKSSKNLIECIKTKDELIAMQNSYAIVPFTQRCKIMLDAYGRAFIETTYRPYGDPLSFTIDDGDNDMDVLSGITLDTVLNRYYISDLNTVEKDVVVKYLAPAASGTTLTDYIKNTIDNMDLIVYRDAINKYYDEKIAAFNQTVSLFADQKNSDVSNYVNSIVKTTQDTLDELKANAVRAVELLVVDREKAQSDAKKYMDDLSVAFQKDMTDFYEAKQIEFQQFIAQVIDSNTVTGLSDRMNHIEEIVSGVSPALDELSNFGTITDFEAGLNA